jgi:signal transduction histidine kinase
VEQLEPELTGQLIALVAHDLRNPLSALQSNVSFVACSSNISDPERQEALDDAGISCEALAHIIDNLDVVSQFMLGRRQSSRIRISAVGVVNEVSSRFERLARSHGGRLTVPRDLLGNDIYVRSNREMLSRALGNLVSNSIQYGGGGAIRIELHAREPVCLFAVSDSGAPVVQELRENAFSAKGQIAAKNKGGGRYSRGLGLFAAAIAAEAAGAHIKASEEDGHNRFELSVPID